MKREKLGSRLGFILLSAGCAIGIGNVWKFPYMAGQNGGGIFVLIYLIFLAILGIPVMVMEFSVGRGAQKSPVHVFNTLEPKGTKWHIHGYLCMAGNIILMMYYTTVAGWMLQYFVKTAQGDFVGQSAEGIATMFGDNLANPLNQVVAMGIVVIVGFFINAQGLQNGLERITKVMMILLLIIMIILAGHSVLVEGGGKGLEFYLKPSLERMNEVGIVNVIVGAMNQAFFTLSLGIGSMAIFGSYIDKEQSLLGESVNVAVLDTFVAITAGLIIFPACFAYGVQPDAGPSLIFITLPNIFNHMVGGRVWGSLFFVFMTFASFSTVLAVFENIMACCMDLFGWTRKKTAMICMVVIFVLSLPCALGYNILSGITPFGEGTTILDLEDFIVSNLLLPGGSIVFILFCVSRYGWGWDNFVKEANEGRGMKVKSFMRPYMTYVLPLLATAILIIGLVNFF
ncbi:MAG: sodium-dependent transporter [Lachnospiraceae bacterium]|nr:sodium-dependent transporter [Lachnospiraceae bacterium]